jgi:uncharacterized protein (DUF2141 family)
VLQANWLQSAPTNNLCSGATGAGAGGYTVVVTSSGTFAKRDFGNYRNATVAGRKFEDANANGSGTGDAGKGGFVINAYADSNGDGTLQASEFSAGAAATATSAVSDGSYTLTGLKPGKYVICEVQQANWFQSAPTAAICQADASLANGGYAETLTSGQAKPADDFGNYQKASMAGRKFEDANADGSGTGDAGKGGFVINAYADSNGDGALQASEFSVGAAAAATSAVSDGSYTLTGLKPGKYVICEVQQANWFQSAPTGTLCQSGSSTLGKGGYTETLTSGQAKVGDDFGNYTTGTVTGAKFQDQNSNGTQDSGDNGLAGWEIRAYVDTNTNGIVDSGETAFFPATTGPTGAYTLALKPGAYVVCEVMPTNWLQTKPTGTRCQNATVPTGTIPGPGGYNVVVTSSSTANSGKDFGNAAFGSTSTITDSSFQLADDLTPWRFTDFEILLNPSNTIVATNPGQFYYHQRGLNTSGSTASMQFTVNWPCQFTTQTAGGQPIHAYVQYASDSANTWRDFTPQSTNIMWTNAPLASCSKTTTAGPLGTGTITVNNVPAGAKVWVTVHLDYALKGTTAPSSSFGTPPISYMPFQSTIAISSIGSSYSSTSLVGRGKKVSMVYGRAIDSSGNPLQNVWIRATQGANVAWAQTDINGNYVFYDGQSCSPGYAGSIQFCTGALSATSTWTFPKGNSSLTLDVMGDDTTTPSASPTYPTGKMTASIVSGTQTFGSKFTATPPGYTLTVANGSAFNRDFKFGT